MYRISVPIHFNVLSDESIHLFLKQVKKSDIGRVFLCTAEPIYSENSIFNKKFEDVKKYVKYFKDSGIETGIWISGFGHGVPLNCDRERNTDYDFTRLEGIGGESYGYAYCPSDKRFTNTYAECVKKIAELEPDLIMLDDDFRINCRRYYFGCFCKNHMRKYERILGEKPDRKKLEAQILTGGSNKYRSAWMKMASETLIGFARKMREAVDSVNESIRLGFCSCGEIWDFCGTDAIELSKVFAGKTTPFLRTCGAPYWSQNRLSRVIDETRVQGHWCKESGVEIFAEGDVYPRPRYMCASNLLELFDLAVLADGSTDGDLKYITDYNQPFGYENGYFDRHMKNKPIRDGVSEMFGDKKNVGIRVVQNIHIFENADFSEQLSEKFANTAMNMTCNQSHRVLSDNAIPTTFEDTGYPVFVSGENAKYINADDLKNGAILDIKAAQILEKRGIATGLINASEKEFEAEIFSGLNDAVYDVSKDEVRGVSSGGLYRIEVSEKATVLSRFIPTDTPSAYTYENKSGNRFYVLAYDAQKFNGDNFLCSYYRQNQIISICKWLCGRNLPAVCTKNPFLYMLASEKEGTLAVSLYNIFADEIISPEIKLEKEYSDIRFLNCSGILDGDKVILSDIAPYGFAAFEVK